jgi:hypothetical protein
MKAHSAAAAAVTEALAPAGAAISTAREPAASGSSIVSLDLEFADHVTLVESALGGHGVGPLRDIEAGDCAFVVNGVRSSQRTRYSFEIGTDRHVEPYIWGRFLNHSCEPNCRVRTRADGLLDVVAKVAIARGTVLTVDYATFESRVGPAGRGACLCGASLCRQTISGYLDLGPEERLALAADLADHLKTIG